MDEVYIGKTSGGHHFCFDSLKSIFQLAEGEVEYRSEFLSFEEFKNEFEKSNYIEWVAVGNKAFEYITEGKYVK